MGNQSTYGHVDVCNHSYLLLKKMFILPGIMAELATGQALFGSYAFYCYNLISIKYILSGRK